LKDVFQTPISDQSSIKSRIKLIADIWPINFNLRIKHWRTTWNWHTNRG